MVRFPAPEQRRHTALSLIGIGGLFPIQPARRAVGAFRLAVFTGRMAREAAYLAGIPAVFPVHGLSFGNIAVV